MLQRIIFTITLFLSFNFVSQAQSKADVMKFRGVFEVHNHPDSYEYAKNAKNEVQVVFSGLFLFYKYFISSQDRASCVFHPSCSVYALQKIQKNGVAEGALATFDRFCRCNAFSAKNYETYQGTQLLYDPVE